MNKIVPILVVVAIVLVGGYFVYTSMNPTSDIQESSQNQVPVTENKPNDNGLQITVDTSTTHTVTYTDAGFSPSALTIKEGDTVVFKNQSSGNMWVGSAMHPSHMVYSGTSVQQHCPDPENDSFDQCRGEAPGASWSFTFTKKGSWGYHDHLDATNFGKITVE